MRISTSQVYNIANISMRDAQVAVDKTNQQISSGKRVLSPADDPVAATSILTIHQEISRTTQYNKNIDAADNSLNLEDSTLQSVTNIIQRLKELAVNAGNTATLTPSDYKAIAAEVDGRLQELTSLQNTRNASGQYIFAGFQSATQPFVSDGGGNFSYVGDEGQLRLQASTTVTVAVSDSGKKVFMDIPSANNTFNTSASSSNKAVPAAIISVGTVVDQAAYDKFYPKDMQITFNANSSVNPPSPNYTITERGTGKVLLDKQVYVSGTDIQFNGVKFSISGSPYPGQAATPATIPMNPAAFTAASAADTDFSLVNGSIQVTVGGITETLKLDQALTTNTGPDSLNNLVTALGGGNKSFYDLPINAGTEAAANFKKLQNLGISFTANGFTSPSGLNITVKNGTPTTGSPNVDNTLGITTSGSGTTSANIPFNFGAPFNFAATPETVDITVNGKTATLVLNSNVTDATTLAAALNNSLNTAALAKLGVIATPSGLTSLNNSPITLSNGGPDVYAAMGVGPSGATTTSGILATPGDSFVVAATNKQGLLTTVSRFSDAMKNVDSSPQGKAALAKMVAATLSNLNNAMTNIASVQGDVGARQNMLESSKDLNSDVQLTSQQVLSQLEDLDYAEASTRLQMQSFVLSAAQQSFVKVSDLSLFKYM